MYMHSNTLSQQFIDDEAPKLTSLKSGGTEISAIYAVWNHERPDNILEPTPFSTSTACGPTSLVLNLSPFDNSLSCLRSLESLQITLAKQDSDAKVSHSLFLLKALLVPENLFRNIKVHFKNSCQNMVSNHYRTYSL